MLFVQSYEKNGENRIWILFIFYIIVVAPVTKISAFSLLVYDMLQ